MYNEFFFASRCHGELGSGHLQVRIKKHKAFKFSFKLSKRLDRETDLLYDPKRSSASAKQRVATIIAHELAHQWFGDYVTMDWYEYYWLIRERSKASLTIPFYRWNVIWLNEG